MPGCTRLHTQVLPLETRSRVIRIINARGASLDDWRSDREGWDAHGLVDANGKLDSGGQVSREPRAQIEVLAIGAFETKHGAMIPLTNTIGCTRWIERALKRPEVEPAHGPISNHNGIRGGALRALRTPLERRVKDNLSCPRGMIAE